MAQASKVIGIILLVISKCSKAWVLSQHLRVTQSCDCRRCAVQYVWRAANTVEGVGTHCVLFKMAL